MSFTCITCLFSQCRKPAEDKTYIPNGKVFCIHPSRKEDKFCFEVKIAHTYSHVKDCPLAAAEKKPNRQS